MPLPLKALFLLPTPLQSIYLYTPHPHPLQSSKGSANISCMDSQACCLVCQNLKVEMANFFLTDSTELKVAYLQLIESLRSEGQIRPISWFV
jgi:hypothetical protein